MKLVSTMSAMCLILSVGLCLSCGGSSEETTPTAGETPSAESVESAVDSAADAAEEAVADADTTVDKIKAELEEKEADLKKVAEELEGLSPQDVMGEKGKELKAKSDALNDEIQKLKDKIDSYME